MALTRIERDSFGEIEVAVDKLWGAQTQRSINNFKIGNGRMPLALVRAIAMIKKAAAEVNCELGVLEEEKASYIVKAATEVMTGMLDNHFPLVVWQTGSGTQTNMNVNEVIANRALQLWGKSLDSNDIHPNDDVNRGQSSNDTFPTAMHVAGTLYLLRTLLPSLQKLIDGFKEKIKEFEGIIKIGRTHTQDATPLYLSDEFSGYLAQLEFSYDHIKDSIRGISYLAQGGTAVGSGINTHRDFAVKIAEKVTSYTGHYFITAKNKFEALASHDALLISHSALNNLAVSLMKIGNDIRFLASGPRAGFAELCLPENEPGSSIMPGKVNPTQIEALTMVCTRVMGNQTTISYAASAGHFELNVFKPVIIEAFLESSGLLSDTMLSFLDKCLKGMMANRKSIGAHLSASLMLVTALVPKLGYDKAASIAKLAHNNGSTLIEEVLAQELMTEQEFNEIMNPALMVKPF